MLLHTGLRLRHALGAVFRMGSTYSLNLDREISISGSFCITVMSLCRPETDECSIWYFWST